MLGIAPMVKQTCVGKRTNTVNKQNVSVIWSALFAIQKMQDTKNPGGD